MCSFSQAVPLSFTGIADHQSRDAEAYITGLPAESGEAGGVKVLLTMGGAGANLGRGLLDADVLALIGEWMEAGINGAGTASSPAVTARDLSARSKISPRLPGEFEPPASSPARVVGTDVENGSGTLLDPQQDATLGELLSALREASPPVGLSGAFVANRARYSRADVSMPLPAAAWLFGSALMAVAILARKRRGAAKVKPARGGGRTRYG